jgi:carboxylesterase type B
LTHAKTGWKQELWTAPDQLVSKSNAVFVALNYRLGIFGFLAGGDDRIPPNLGLLDQRLAMEW